MEGLISLSYVFGSGNRAVGWYSRLFLGPSCRSLLKELNGLLSGFLKGIYSRLLRLMDKILHDPKDPKLWELWYIP